MSIKPLLIEFHTTDVVNMSGTSQRTGKDYSINKQLGYLFLNGSPYPEKIELTLNDGQPPYNIGKYYVDLNQAASIDRFGSIGIDARNLKLHLVTEKAAG